MLFEVLLVHICAKIETVLVSDFYIADMQGVNDILYSFRCGTGCSCKREDSKVWVLRHEISDDLSICIVTGAFMCFICSKR